MNRRLHKSGYHEVSRYIVPSTDPSSPLRTQSKTFDYDQDHSTRRLYDEEDSHLRRRVPRKMAQDDLENQVRVSSAEIAQARESIKPSKLIQNYPTYLYVGM